jgi:hypothetical protein
MQRKLTVGTYETTNAFRQIGEHCAVIVEETKALVAITGPSHELEAQRVAKLFAAAPDLLAACEEIETWYEEFLRCTRCNRFAPDNCTLHKKQEIEIAARRAFAILKAKGENQ